MFLSLVFSADHLSRPEPSHEPDPRDQDHRCGCKDHTPVRRRKGRQVKASYIDPHLVDLLVVFLVKILHDHSPVQHFLRRVLCVELPVRLVGFRRDDIVGIFRIPGEECAGRILDRLSRVILRPVAPVCIGEDDVRTCSRCSTCCAPHCPALRQSS